MGAKSYDYPVYPFPTSTFDSWYTILSFDQSSVQFQNISSKLSILWRELYRPIACLLSVFSACGGIVYVVFQFWQPTFPCWLRVTWDRVDCRLFMATPLKGCLVGLTGSSTRAGTGCTNSQLNGSSVADCQTLTWLHFNLLHHYSLGKNYKIFMPNSCAL